MQPAPSCQPPIYFMYSILFSVAFVSFVLGVIVGWLAFARPTIFKTPFNLENHRVQ